MLAISFFLQINCQHSFRLLKILSVVLHLESQVHINKEKSSFLFFVLFVYEKRSALVIAPIDVTILEYVAVDVHLSMLEKKDSLLELLLTALTSG